MIRIYNLIYTFLLAFALTFLFTGCVYDRFDEFGMEYGEGFGDLQVKVEFENLSPALDTRAAGNAIGAVSNLQMVIYRVENGVTSFHKRVVCNTLPDYKVTNTNTAEPSDAEQTPNGNNSGQFQPTGEVTDHAEFSIKDLPYGIYKIYAVANVPGLTDEQCQTEERLKSIQFGWDADNVANNKAMFGYFTREPQKSADFDAPLVLVNAANVNIHAWIKRLASKVTVAFDPSELKEAVTVYIKSVTIHDIPDSCRLGVNNKPGVEHLIKNGESIDYSNGSTDYSKWGIKLQKGSGPKGSFNHTNTDNALFFFENMQGNFKDAPNAKDYLKVQIPEETGSSVDAPGDNKFEGNADNDYKDRVKAGTYIEVVGYYVSKNTEKMSSGNIKYRFMLGKDVLYDYNAQRNYHYKLTLKLRGFANEADWHISYTEPTPSLYTPDQYYISYLYGQESQFPVRIVTGTDASQSGYTLVAEIIENPWWPTDEDNQVRVTVGSGKDPNGFAWMKSAVFPLSGDEQGVLSSPHYKGDDKNFVGFLSLRQPQIKNGKVADITEADVIDVTESNGRDYGEKHNIALKTYYKDHYVATAAYTLQTGTRNVCRYDSTHRTLVQGSSTDGQYTVTKDQDGSVTMKLPMYTRPLKMLAGTDFTGNNPYSSYIRKATVRFRLLDSKGNPVKFKDLADHDKMVEERYVPIIQVRRVENPKAIYRAAGNNDPFHVVLMHRRDKDYDVPADSFEPFESDGPWRASILACSCEGDHFVTLTTPDGQSINKKGEYIHGSTGTNIDFTYTPTGSCGANETKCAIILVEYHDYTCNHMIFVRWGYDKGVKLAGTNWSLYQVYAAKGPTNSTEPEDGADKTAIVDVTKNPLSVGSLLKRGQYSFSIREADNPGWLEDISDLSVAYYNDKNEVAEKKVGWGSFGGFGWYRYDGKDQRYTRTWADTWKATVNGATKELTVPTYKQYEDLRDNCDFGFGIAYADEAKETATLLTDAYGYIDEKNTGVKDSKGMRVCVAYNSQNGDNILFPLGKDGNARRTLGGATLITSKANYGVGSKKVAGVLSYSGLASVLYQTSTTYRPITYNHYRTPGAMYWVKTPKHISGDDQKSYATWDINYFTLTFNNYSAASIGNFDGKVNSDGSNVTNAGSCSDAVPIKLIYKKSTD